MLHAACESAAMNVRINLNALHDPEFVGWKTEEVESVLNTSSMMLEEIRSVVAEKLSKS